MTSAHTAGNASCNPSCLDNERVHAPQDTLHSLVMWRAIRHKFIFGSPKGKNHGHISCPRCWVSDWQQSVKAIFQRSLDAAKMLLHFGRCD